MTKKVTIFLLLLSVSGAVVAQNFLSWKLADRYFTVQTGIGFTHYFGELQHTGEIGSDISNLSLGLEARLLNRFSVRAELARYSINGSDANAPDSTYERQRNLSFDATNWEFSIQGIFFMRKYHESYHKRWQLDPYLMAGIGTTFLSPTTEFSEQTIRLHEFQTEGVDYSQVTIVVPLGAGLKFRINPFINFITEISYRFTFSDYLDDVSGSYPETYPDFETALISNRKDEIPVVNDDAYDNLLVPGGPRGNSSTKDSYLLLNLKLEFYLPPSFLRKKG